MENMMLFANAFTDFFGKYGTIILMVGAVAVMFIFMFRSQKKQEKEANQMRNNLQIGDETAGHRERCTYHTTHDESGHHTGCALQTYSHHHDRS